jgi:F-type H+-transporting ATPase subunit a
MGAFGGKYELRNRWRRVSGHPLVLLTSLVLGVGLMFGAPLLLAQHSSEEESRGEEPVTEQGSRPHAAEEARGEETHGEESHAGETHVAGEHHEEGTVHPPTLVSVLANLIESSHRKSLREPGRWAALPLEEKHKLEASPHVSQDYMSPVARFLVTYSAPIFSVLVAIILCTICIAGAKAMTLVPGRFQNLVEMVLEGLSNFVEGVLGPTGKRFVPFLGTLFLYIYFQNIFGLIPFMFTPTSVLSTTVALAIVVFLYVQWVGIRSNGVVGYLKHLAGDPKDAVGWAMAPLMFPLHVVGEMAKPVSLSLRLFGNMMGEETLIAVFIGLGVGVLAVTGIPAGVPFHVPFIFLALLTTLIQALVFMLLSTIYFALVLPHHEAEGH